MTTNTDGHTCSYYCERPECVRRQRDELRERMESALAQQPPSAPVGVEGFEQWYARVDARFWNNWDACNAAFHAGKRAALAQQPAAPSGAVNVVGMPEFDGLLDHIYEHGTAAEGVVERANAFARAVIARYAPQQPAAVDEAMLERALIADAREYGASIPESRARRLLAAALAAQQQGGHADV